MGVRALVVWRGFQIRGDCSSGTPSGATFLPPSAAERYVHALVDYCQYHILECDKRGDDNQGQRHMAFKRIFQSEAAAKIINHAELTLKMSKFNKTVAIPKTSTSCSSTSNKKKIPSIPPFVGTRTPCMD